MTLDRHITLAHGNGGRHMRALIEEIFARHLANPSLDVGLDAAPFAVQAVQFGGLRQRGGVVRGEQAGDAQAHVRQPSGRVEAGPDHEAEVLGRGARRIAAGGPEQGADAGHRLAGTHALQSLVHRHADLEPFDQPLELAGNRLRHFPGDDLERLGGWQARLDAAHNGVDGIGELGCEGLRAPHFDQ